MSGWLMTHMQGDGITLRVLDAHRSPGSCMLSYHRVTAWHSLEHLHVHPLAVTPCSRAA